MTFYATGKRLEGLRLFRLENMDSRWMTHKFMGKGKLIPTLLLLLMPWVGTAAGKASSARDVSEIIAMKNSLDKSSILVKGEISYVYTCPPCPEGMECKPCGGDFICLKSLSGADQLIVNCSSEDTICFSLKPGRKIAIDIVYEANSQVGAMSGWNGRFVFKSLATTAMNKSRSSPAASKKKVKALPHSQ